MGNCVSFKNKIRVSGRLEFETAFHIGAGKTGTLGTNMGVLKDFDGIPLLPGSTLKGIFRSTAEKLAWHFKLWACFFDLSLNNEKDRYCISDEKYRIHEDTKKELEALKKEECSEERMWEWINNHTCDVCKIFGSPMLASRIFFSDAKLEEWAGNVLIRDGVSIDRDSETAVDQAKYDYEVVPRGAAFSFVIEIQNYEDTEIALIAAVISEWENGLRIGGFTSRGMGKCKFTLNKVETLDYANPDQLKNYLLEKKMKQDNSFFDNKLKLASADRGGQQC